MASTKKSCFCLSSEQKEQLENKLLELSELCQIYRIPMFVACVTENSDSGTKYNNIIYGPESHSIVLQDDKIAQYALIASGGFTAVPKREVLSFDPFGVMKRE